MSLRRYRRSVTELDKTNNKLPAETVRRVILVLRIGRPAERFCRVTLVSRAGETAETLCRVTLVFRAGETAETVCRVARVLRAEKRVDVLFPAAAAVVLRASVLLALAIKEM